jgi:hypothetical protein
MLYQKYCWSSIVVVQLSFKAMYVSLDALEPMKRQVETEQNWVIQNCLAMKTWIMEKFQ